MLESIVTWLIGDYLGEVTNTLQEVVRVVNNLDRRFTHFMKNLDVEVAELNSKLDEIDRNTTAEGEEIKVAIDQLNAEIKELKDSEVDTSGLEALAVRLGVTANNVKNIYNAPAPAEEAGDTEAESGGTEEATGEEGTGETVL